MQEKGVDEPDTIKTDGDIIVTVNAGVVYILKANDGNPVVQSKIPAGDQATDNVFLSGQRLMLFGSDDYEKTVVSTYDIADLTAPNLVGRTSIDGRLVDARMVGTQVRLTSTFTPGSDITSPKSTRDLSGVVDDTTLEDWTPQYVVTGPSGAPLAGGQLVPCESLSHPAIFSGLKTSSLITFDIFDAPSAPQAIGVLADGSQMYANETSTYISSTVWQSPENAKVTTDIHKFATSVDGVSTYLRLGCRGRNVAQFVFDVRTQGRVAGRHHRLGEPRPHQFTTDHRRHSDDSACFGK